MEAGRGGPGRGSSRNRKAPGVGRGRELKEATGVEGRGGGCGWRMVGGEKGQQPGPCRPCHTDKVWKAFKAGSYDLICILRTSSGPEGSRVKSWGAVENQNRQENEGLGDGHGGEESGQ